MARSAPPAQPDSITFATFKGIKNIVGSERLTPQELEIAVNVDIDDAGQIRRRRGQTKVVTGDCSSLYNAKSGQVYAVVNQQLGLLNPNYSFIPLTAAGPDPLIYEEINGTIYWTSRSMNGKLVNGITPAPWGRADGQDYWLSPVVSPTATLAKIRGKLLKIPPVATALGYLNGRLYMAAGQVVWATELYLYDYVDATRNYLFFEEDVTMIGMVQSGMYVGTTAALWFCSGPFSKMGRTLIVDHPVIPGSMVRVCADLADPTIPLDQFSPDKNAIMFMTSRGMCLGLDDGKVYNKTEDMIWFPIAKSAAALYRQQDGVNAYVVSLDHGGSPSDAGRIGDYVDAELRRPGDWGYLHDGVRISDAFIVDKV